MQTSIDERLASLTLEEKASLCSGQNLWESVAIERLGIPACWLADGPHGLRKAPSAAKVGIGDSLAATCFPTASALGASWDVDLMYELGEALGREARALGVHVLLGPGINIKRLPIGGRNFEYFSEDPLLTGQLAAALVKGVQAQGVAACPKHFACNNQEHERMFNDSRVDVRTLHEIYLKAFEVVVKQAAPWCMMTAYNRVNGTFATEHPYLLGEVLREQWGYQGALVSDWGAVNDRVASVRVGMTLEMPGNGGLNDQQIVEAVRAGSLEEASLDELVRDWLRLVERVSATPTAAPPSLDWENHHRLAQRIAEESVVLLRNEDDLLPLALDQGPKVALLGRFAREARYQGAGSSQVVPTQLSQLYDVLQGRLPEEALSYADGYPEGDGSDEALLHQAQQLAQRAEVAIVCVGLPPAYESEGIDRPHLNLPANHQQLIAAVADVQPNTVVILFNGAPVCMPWANRVKAILEANLGGQAIGAALARILNGEVNPSGKLAETFPQRYEDTPAYLHYPGSFEQVAYGEGLFVGYRYYDSKNLTPHFPFGHGLSYTRFAYEAAATPGYLEPGGRLTLELRLTNTGSRKGKEVVQVYARPKQSLVMRPAKELKAFAKVALEAREQRMIQLELAHADFAYFHPRKKAWVVEAGMYELLIGASSRDIRLRTVVELEAGQDFPEPFHRYTPMKRFMAHDALATLTRPLWEPFAASFQGEDAEMVDSKEFLEAILHDLPIIKLVNLSQGKVTEAMVDACVQMANERRVP